MRGVRLVLRLAMYHAAAFVAKVRDLCAAGTMLRRRIVIARVAKSKLRCSGFFEGDNDWNSRMKCGGGFVAPLPTHLADEPSTLYLASFCFVLHRTRAADDVEAGQNLDTGWIRARNDARSSFQSILQC
jgi:hypothetical protein